MDSSLINVSLSTHQQLDVFERLTQNTSDSEDSNEIFEVERILGHRDTEPKFDKTVKRLIRAKQYSAL